MQCVNTPTHDGPQSFSLDLEIGISPSALNMCHIKTDQTGHVCFRYIHVSKKGCKFVKKKHTKNMADKNATTNQKK